MAFNLDGTIRKELITEVMIPSVRRNMIGQAMLTTKEGIDAESIKVWGIGSVTVGDYTGGEISSNAHNDTSVNLNLDTVKYFAERVEEIDNYQSALDILPAILEEGSYALGNEMDKDIFTELANTTSDVGDYVLDATNIKTFISDMSVAMSNAGAPKFGRKLAITPEAVAYLTEAGITSGSNEIATEAGREGFVTRFGGFDIYESINLADADTGKWAIATVQGGGALGLGYNKLAVEHPGGQNYDVALGLINYGVKVVQNDYVFKADIS